MKATIIYPDLVEQSYSHLKKMGVEVKKAELYKEMVANGLIDELGNPTAKALNEGLVVGFSAEHKTLLAFKEQFTVFKSYSSKEFLKSDGMYYISVDITSDVSNKISSNSYDDDELNQIATYYNFRNYDKPKTIGEFKGVNHPMYSSYDDSHFHIIDGRIHIDSFVVRDLAERVISGEIDGNAETSRQVLADLDNL